MSGHAPVRRRQDDIPDTLENVTRTIETSPLRNDMMIYERCRDLVAIAAIAIAIWQLVLTKDAMEQAERALQLTGTAVVLDTYMDARADWVAAVQEKRDELTEITAHYSEVFKVVCELADKGMLSEATEKRVRTDAEDLLKIVSDKQKKVLEVTLSDCLE